MNLVLQAPAKLNLGLEVVGRRDDGYHELCSILVSVNIADTVQIGAGNGFAVEGPRAAGVPHDPEGNLAWRALKALESMAGGPLDLSLRITKNIPSSAGLGGGSADAAAVLRAAPDLGLDPPLEALLDQAVALGADIPFQLLGGVALVGGIGEKIARLPYRQTWFAVAHGGEPVSTAEVFAELRPQEWTSGESVQAAALALDADTNGTRSLALLRALPNALSAPAMRRHPGLADAADRLRRAGWTPKLTGTGSAMFQVCADEPEARSLVAGAATLGFSTWACHALPPHPWKPATGR